MDKNDDDDEMITSVVPIWMWNFALMTEGNTHDAVDDLYALVSSIWRLSYP